MIREARADDIPRLLEMGRAFHEATQQIAPFSDEACTRLVMGLMEAETGIVLASDRGMIGGTLAPAYCSDDWTMAVELFWWAKDKQGLRLLTAFEDWARAMRADEIRMSTIHHVPGADRILAKRGYTPTEISHTRAI